MKYQYGQHGERIPVRTRQEALKAASAVLLYLEQQAARYTWIDNGGGVRYSSATAALRASDPDRWEAEMDEAVRQVKTMKAVIKRLASDDLPDPAEEAHKAAHDCFHSLGSFAYKCAQAGESPDIVGPAYEAARAAEAAEKAMSTAYYEYRTERGLKPYWLRADHDY